MDPTWLYYALSTIAQCAAALAALIGFLGLWRLDRLKQERDQVERDLRGLLVDLRVSDLRVNAPHIDAIIHDAEDLVAHPRDDKERARAPKVNTTLSRWRTIPREQQRFMGVLQRFLRKTLVILALAIIGLVLANMLNAWVVTRWLLRLLIILAGVRLWRDTASVMREAARSIQARTMLALLLLASAALAGPVRCTTYEEKTLNRLQTLCDDGTRAVSHWNATLGRWDTTVTPPPGQRCTGQLNPHTQQVEVRCR